MIIFYHKISNPFTGLLLINYSLISVRRLQGEDTLRIYEYFEKLFFDK